MSWFWKKKEVPPKPEDRIEYQIGFSCRAGHVTWVCDKNKYFSDVLGEKMACSVCGGEALPAIIKIQTEYRLRYVRFVGEFWGEDKPSYKFVRFLDKEDSIWLDERVISTLRKYAARPYQESDSDPDVAYQKGLHDGTIETAKFVLGELEEKTTNA